MGQHLPLLEDARLLVEHGTQQVVGVQHALHQHVGHALAHQLHGLCGGIVVVGSLQPGHFLQGTTHQLRIAHQYRLDEALVHGLLHGSLRRLVVGAHHGHPLRLHASCEIGHQLIKVLYRFHIK